MGERQYDLLESVVEGLGPAQVELVTDFARMLAEPAAASDAESADMAVTTVRIGAVVEGAGGHWLRRFEGSDRWALDGASSAASWLDHHAETSKARAAVKLKRARTLPSLKIIDDALSSGMIGDEKVRLLLDVHKRIPEAVFDNQQYLVDTVVRLTVEGAHLFLATWAEKMCPSRPDTDDGPAPEPAGGRSHLAIHRTLGGAHVNGFFDPEHDASIAGAISAELDTWRREGLLEGDTRTRPELNVAALAAITARHGQNGDQHGQPRPLALVLADADTLAGRVGTPESPNMTPVCELLGHGPISADTARRLLCGADISRVILRGDSEILDVGMRHRLATPGQRRGLIAVTAGRCEFPGCDAPHEWCQVHHLDPFNPNAGTGPTDLANLALVCSRHHTAIHEGHFKMTRGPTGIQVTRPDGTTIAVPKTHRPRDG